MSSAGRKARKRRREPRPRWAGTGQPIVGQSATSRETLFARLGDVTKDGRVHLPGRQFQGNPCPEVRIRGDVAAERADLESICFDLQFVSTCCEAFLAMDVTFRESGADEGLLLGMRASMEALIIAYGRCFTDGKSAAGPGVSRYGVPDSLIDELSEEMRATHEHLLFLRNKLIAHRVDQTWHQVLVTAVLYPTEAEAHGVLQIGTIATVTAPGADSAAKFQALAQHLLGRMQGQLQEMDDDLLRRLRAVDPDQLYEAGTSGIEWTLDA